MSIDAPHISDLAVTVQQSRAAHLLVPPAMLVAAAAMGVASHLHLGLAVELAATVGIALFCIMLLCHVLLSAADAAERAEDEAAERGMAQVESPMPRQVGSAEQLTAAAAGPPPLFMPPFERQVTKSDLPSTMAEPAALGEGGAAVDNKPLEQIQLSVAETSNSSNAQMPWVFRPSDIRQPSLETVVNAGARPLEADLGDLRPAIAETLAGQDQSRSSNSSADADRIDAILKRLAAQIHAGSAAMGTAAGVAGDVGPAPMPSLETMAGEDPDHALASAVDALRSTVEAMRGDLATTANGGVVLTPAPSAVSAPTAVELRLAAVAEALAAERVDVFLLPVLGLADEQAQHFEVSVQLRATTGEPLDARAIASGSSGAGGTGLLPLFDALSVRHAAGFALKLERRGRDGIVFSRVGGQSLESEQFVTDVAGRQAQGIADRMVLSFAQAELKALGPAQLAALEDLGRLGFRFALQGVADLDMDFEALEAMGFEFVKLDAEVFLRGLQCSGTEIPASDICRHFDDLGFRVIVSGIDDEAMRLNMLGCGVVLGQGLLFGAPRPVPVVASSHTIAA